MGDEPIDQVVSRTLKRAREGARRALGGPETRAERIARLAARRKRRERQETHTEADTAEEEE
jgi:hypothetical protein